MLWKTICPVWLFLYYQLFVKVYEYIKIKINIFFMQNPIILSSAFCKNYVYLFKKYKTNCFQDIFSKCKGWLKLLIKNHKMNRWHKNVNILQNMFFLKVKLIKS